MRLLGPGHVVGGALNPPTHTHTCWPTIRWGQGRAPGQQADDGRGPPGRSSDTRSKIWNALSPLCGNRCLLSRRRPVRIWRNCTLLSFCFRRSTVPCPLTCLPVRAPRECLAREVEELALLLLRAALALCLVDVRGLRDLDASGRTARSKTPSKLPNSPYAPPANSINTM